MRNIWLALCVCACGARVPIRAPARGDIPIIVLKETERAEEAAWLTRFGLKVPSDGVLLREPFALPLTGRSFVVPTAWYRAQSPTTVKPAELAADLDVLAVAFERVYGGYDRARMRGFDWSRWIASWKKKLREAGDARIATATAFEPFLELMATQLDNHTGPMLPEVSFGSSSRTTLLAGPLPNEPCTRLRTSAGTEHELDPRDRATQPREALLYRGPGAPLAKAAHVVSPAVLGLVAAIRCGGEWRETLAAEQATEDQRADDMLSLLGRTTRADDTPAYTTLSPDIGYLRLPTFTKRDREASRNARDVAGERR